jgi:hypothetical protein
MDFKFYQKVLLVIAIPLFICSKCNKDDTSPCRNARYGFRVTSEFFPQKEIYNIGDTILLISSFSKSLKDQISGNIVDYSNSLGIGGNLLTIELDSTTKSIKSALPKFSYFGNASPLDFNKDDGLNIFYTETSNYELKVGMILKEKGIYRFAVPSLASNGIKGLNCTNASFNLLVTNTNKNIHLFKSFYGNNLSSIDSSGLFFFKVR